MTFVLDDDFECFLEDFGAPVKYQSPTSETFQQYRGKLPDRLLEYWHEFGFSSFKDGLFWTVNPADHQESMNAWLSSTDIPKEDTYHVIARSGFGDLFLWGERTGSKYTIETRQGRIFKEQDDSKRISEGKADHAISAFFGLMSPEDVDLKDVDTNQFIFKIAVKKFGPLKEDEVFGFEPALFAGGERVIGKLNKVNFPVHLDILLQMVGKPQVMDIHGLAKIAFGH